MHNRLKIGRSQFKEVISISLNSGILTMNPLKGGITMTGAIAALAIGSDQVAGDNAAFQSLFFVGLSLFVMTLGLNIISERVVRRYRQRY